MVNFRYMSIIKFVFLLLTIIAVGYVFYPVSYPVEYDIDLFFKNYKTLSNDTEKRIALKNILSKLEMPKNANDDRCLQYFIEKLECEYLSSEDETILVVIDQVEIDGGFANFICEFYNTVKETQTFKQRYSSNSKLKSKVERCIGLSYSQEELNATLLDK